jgi:hypothetical protein
MDPTTKRVFTETQKNSCFHGTSCQESKQKMPFLDSDPDTNEFSLNREPILSYSFFPWHFTSLPKSQSKVTSRDFYIRLQIFSQEKHLPKVKNTIRAEKKNHVHKKNCAKMYRICCGIRDNCLKKIYLSQNADSTILSCPQRILSRILKLKIMFHFFPHKSITFTQLLQFATNVKNIL